MFDESPSSDLEARANELGQAEDLVNFKALGTTSLLMYLGYWNSITAFGRQLLQTLDLLVKPRAVMMTNRMATPTRAFLRPEISAKKPITGGPNRNPE